MPHTFYLVPSGGGVGLTSLALGLVRALDNRGIRVAFFKPIGQPVDDLSRGALVEDIVYTIALTAIQAGQPPAVV